MEETAGLSPERSGKILRGIAGFYYVETEDGHVYACRARGIFRREEIRPLPGDDVRFVVTHEGDAEGSLTEILPRRNALVRPAVANVDQALLFFSVRDPAPSLLMLDRYLLFLARYALPTVLCFNKSDIAEPGEAEALADAYRQSGHAVHIVSVRTGEGVGALVQTLDGQTTFLAGPSGAGKSSLINRICQEVRAETGELSRKLSRGKNTTRHSELFRVAAGAWLIDTPGFTALALPEMEESALADVYAEFAPYTGRCRFASCLHLAEPGCAVREAAESGAIPMARYENYRRLCGELKEKREKRYG